MPSSASTLSRPPRSPLFPYTTLFRSRVRSSCGLISSETVAPAPTYLQAADGSSAQPPSRQLAAVMHRYNDAYLYARVTVGIGSLIKGDRKSTRLNSSHANISYAVFCFNA